MNHSIMNVLLDDEVLQWWGLKKGGGDPVTSNWLGVDSVIYPVTMICIYLALLRASYNRIKPFQTDIKGILLVYNLFQVLLSAFIFSETVITAYNSSYNILCEPLHSTLSENGRRMAVASWLFYISKYFDLFDTFFMIVKGNTHQISILHVFHHSSMILNSWFGIRHVPTGHSFFIHLSNSFVHVVMYSYYFLSSFGQWIKPYLWWKPYLTQLQIVQFFLMWIHVAVGLYTGCPYPKCLIYLVLVYLVFLIALFINFYLRTYVLKQKSASKLSKSKKQS